MRAVIFDLDGTLVDSVYAHVLAWQRVLEDAGMTIPAWRVHRLIGMSGGLLTRAAAHEAGRDIPEEEAEALQKQHGAVYAQLLPVRRPLPGAVDLLRHLRESKISHGIATSGRRDDIRPSLEALQVPPDAVVVDRTDVQRAKPEPDLFLACQTRLAVPPEQCYVVGDAVWDLLAARRAGMLSIGVLSGGYGEDELARAGAYRVYRDAAELLANLYQLGLRR